jgi:hypothetical protein
VRESTVILRKGRVAKARKNRNNRKAFILEQKGRALAVKYVVKRYTPKRAVLREPQAEPPAASGFSDERSAAGGAAEAFDLRKIDDSRTGKPPERRDLPGDR